MVLENTTSKTEGDSFFGDKWVLESNIETIEPAGDAFVERLAEFGWDKESDEVSKLRLGFCEAITNAIIHGNKEDPNKKVQVEIQIDENNIRAVVTDEGEGFVPKDVPDSRVGNGLLKPSGRGISLMREFFNEVEYNEKGNEVTMVKKK